MLTSDDLAMIRAAFERYLASTAELNRIFMAAWRGGYLDELWAEYRKDDASLWLTYYIRARAILLQSLIEPPKARREAKQVAA